MSPEQGQQIIDAHAAQLCEHFGSVQILASLPFERGTMPLYSGRGDWFARQGLAHDFINLDQARQLALQITTTED